MEQTVLATTMNIRWFVCRFPWPTDKQRYQNWGYRRVRGRMINKGDSPKLGNADYHPRLCANFASNNSLHLDLARWTEATKSGSFESQNHRVSSLPLRTLLCLTKLSLNISNTFFDVNAHRYTLLRTTRSNQPHMDLTTPFFADSFFHKIGLET